jgi:protein O-mannosyl-transferase
VASDRVERRRKRGTSAVAAQPKNRPTGRGTRTIWLSAVLVAATLTTYAGSLQNGFVNFDDDKYVFDNPRLQQGLSLSGIRWAFATTEFSNWHPLTWLSYELDYSMFGLEPTGYHATNLLLHCANTVLLFHALTSMTGAASRSAVVAALFALHPLHVESVAWVAERKDVLSGLFLMLTLWAYHCYAMAPGWRRYLVVAAAFALGLMAKPMLVTLPCVLLLLDFWPLQRWRSNRWSWLCLEKTPLLALTLVSCFVTYQVQRETGALKTAEQLSFAARLANVPVAYFRYFAKTVWPGGLAVYYPHPQSASSLTMTMATGIGLLIASAVVIWSARRFPYLAVGWFWWLGMLIPVIGVIQVGGQAYADRYMYLPLIGLAMAAVWAVDEMANRGRWPAWLAPATAVTLLVALAVVSRQQIAYWHDGVSLWQRAIAVTTPNPVAFNSLGVALAEENRLSEAREVLEKGIAVAPDDEHCRLNLGLVYLRLRKFDSARSEFQEALRANPASLAAHYNLGVIAGRQGETQTAVEHFQEVLKIDPNYVRAHLQLARALVRQGRVQEAEWHAAEAIRINPSFARTGSAAPE